MLLQVFVTNKILAANKVGAIEDGNESIRKCEKLFKIRKLSKGLKLSKSRNLKKKKLFKFQKSAKLGKKLAKIGNSLNFDAEKNGLNFLNSNARMTFNYL